MADHRINIIPPASGTLSLNQGDNLFISASGGCTFSCSAGDSFLPSLGSVELSAGDNGPYIAQQQVAATYSATVATASRATEVHTMTARSVQVTTP